MAKVKGEMVKRLLPCKLTTAELATRAQELAQAEIYRGQVERDYAAAADDWKAAKKLWDSKTMTASEACVRLGKVVKTGEEERDVECSITVERGQTTLARLDTGEVVIQRPATDAEMQQSLDLDGAK
jgi:hypothetical protein